MKKKNGRLGIMRYKPYSGPKTVQKERKNQEEYEEKISGRQHHISPPEVTIVEWLDAVGEQRVELPRREAGEDTVGGSGRKLGAEAERFESDRTSRGDRGGKRDLTGFQEVKK